MAGKGQRSVEASDTGTAPAAWARMSSSSRRPTTRPSPRSWRPAPSPSSRPQHATYERIVVPGALEIPQALAQAVKAGVIGSDDANARFDGCVALGCVIRGETSHYDIVCNNANHWLMEVAVAQRHPARQRHPDRRHRGPGAGARARRPRGQGRRCRARLPRPDRARARLRRRGPGMSAAGKGGGKSSGSRAARPGSPPCRRSTRWTWPRPTSPR